MKTLGEPVLTASACSRLQWIVAQSCWSYRKAWLLAVGSSTRVELCGSGGAEARSSSWHATYVLKEEAHETLLTLHLN
jgi:hypothetical protein